MADPLTAPLADPLTGTCLCGACALNATPTDAHASICHCSMCRKWTGGIFVSVPCRDVAFGDDAPLNVYASSDWAERVSCAACGSSILYRTRDGGAAYVSVQMFEDPGAFPVRTEIFIDDKPRSYALAGAMQQMTGAEVMALYAPQKEG